MDLSGRFVDAVAYALRAHAGQVRKGTEATYLSHVLSVAALVLEHGGDEDTAIAALLHDSAEDAGGQGRLDDIRAKFGSTVADTVVACSDTLQSPKPPWRQRKEAFLARIPHFSPAARLVSQADLLHNARSILADLRVHGAALWERFKGGQDGTLWYYRSAIAAHGQAGESVLIDELRFVVDQIERLGGSR